MALSYRGIAIVIALICITITDTNAQSHRHERGERVPLVRKSVNITSGHYSRSLSEPGYRRVQRSASYANAPWVQVEFGDYNLGKRSFIIIESHPDGAIQRLDARSIEHWRGRSAYFNGNAVTITLNIAPGERTSTEDEIEGEVPLELQLLQNYPNPAKENTRMMFVLPEGGEVRLSVYDVLGRVVARPVNGYREKGRHQLDLNLSDLSSGTYVYRLETPETAMSRRLLVLR